MFNIYLHYKLSIEPHRVLTEHEGGEQGGEDVLLHAGGAESNAVSLCSGWSSLRIETRESPAPLLHPRGQPYQYQRRDYCYIIRWVWKCLP